MDRQKHVEELTRIFRRIGAPEPDSWARSEVTEDIPQLCRFLFLRQAWRLLVAEQDHSWIDNAIKEPEDSPGAPCSGIGPALKRLIAEGIDRQDLTDVVRIMQYDVLFGLCYLLDDPGDVEPEVANVCWGLFELDENGRIGRPIGGLHESVLNTDPTGREMRPRPEI